ncbi:cytosolic phospholipase A2 [Pelomyxa schiedti]|nr:cytosolic phospholipase A2 [Pelomyxa schiedti]
MIAMIAAVAVAMRTLVPRLVKRRPLSNIDESCRKVASFEIATVCTSAKFTSSTTSASLIASASASSSKSESQSTSSPACTTSTCTERGGAKRVEAEPLVIAICGSGGGMRAMQSMVGFMDGLSHIGLLDAVTLAVGLSGSTWCLSQWVCDTEGNPFHGGKCEDDPWRSGGPSFDSARHTHSELKKMLSQHSITAVGAKLVRCMTSKGNLVDGWSQFMSDVVLSGRHMEATRFSQCKNRLADGSFPIPVCTAISENKQDSWDWVDFTPFTVRKCGTPLKATENLSDDTLPHLMAVWGSFFAIDWKSWHSKIPTILGWFPLFSAVPETGRKRKPIFCAAATEGSIGNLRDAGIDFNVPLPALHGRGVDVVLVMDSTADAKGTEELALAVKAGHISICEEDKRLLSTPFGPQERCRFFRPERTGQPAIAYFLASTQSSTANLQYEPQEVDGIVQSVYNAVISESETLRWFIRKVEQAKGSVPVTPLIPCCPRQSPLRDIVRPVLKQRYCELYEYMALLDHLGHMAHPPFSVLYTSLQVAGSSRYGGLGKAVGVGRLWSAVLLAGRTRCVVEGDPGSGKSTLVKFLAREQGTVEMEQQFGAIIVVELRELCSIATHPHSFQPVNLRDCVEDYLLRVLMLDDDMIKLIFAHSKDILWVFDGFDEVDTEKWESFLGKLVLNKLEWAPCVMVTARHDRRHQIFSDTTTVIVQQWNPAEISTYIKRYFDYVNEFGLTAESRALLPPSVSKFISDNPELARMAKTPLLCEIICTVYSKMRSDTSSVTTIFKHLVSYAWDRAKNKLGITEDHTWSNEIKESICVLRERAYNSTVSTVANDLAGLFHLDMNKPIERRASFCGLVKRCSLEDGGPHIHGFRFIHKTLEEFFTAWHICSKKNAPNAIELLEGIFTDKTIPKGTKWSPKERNLVLFIASFIHSSRKHYIKQIQEPFIGLLFTVFNSNYNTNYKELSADLSRDASHPTRDKWRVQLGLDAVVAAVTLLGDDATERFLKSIRPYGWQASRVMPNFLTLKIAPWIYRLLTEPAAQYGNLTMLKRLVNYAGGEMDQAMMEAHLSGQRSTIDWLTSMKAGGVSVGIPARMGNHKAVCQMLAEVEGIEKKKELALEAASEAFKNRQACVLRELCKLYSPNDLVDSIIPHILPFNEGSGPTETYTAELISQFFSGVTILKVPSSEETKKDSNDTCVTIAYSFPSLTHLTCARCPRIGIVAIAKSCTALADLHCSEMSVNSFCATAQFFRALRHLEVHHLKGRRSSEDRESSPPFTTLTSLCLGATSTVDVSSIAPWCPALTSLTLYHSLTDTGASALAQNCPGLTTLFIVRITRDGVTAIANHLHSLTHLTLREETPGDNIDLAPVAQRCSAICRMNLGPSLQHAVARVRAFRPSCCVQVFHL